MNKRGLFVVIEGSDGSGKKTQFNLLKERLKATGYAVAEFDFPRYDQDSSYFVRQYLKGNYGPAGSISPYTAALFYALDRFEASKDIEIALRNGKIVLANRFTGSNMAHQGSKFDDAVEQRGFFVWSDNLEFQLLKIPRPDVSFFLRVPAKLSKRLIEERAAKTGAELDGHEKDTVHLKKTLATYDVLCRLFPKDFKAIDCAKNGQLMSVPEINNLVWNELKPLLPPEKPNPARSAVVSLGVEENKAREEQLTDGELVFNFKDASLLLRLQIEHINISTISSSDKPWTANYDFYTPYELPRELAKTYKALLQNIASLHQALKTQLSKLEVDGKTENLLLAATPLAALSTFSVNLKKEEIRTFCSQLLSEDSEEARWAAKQLYMASRQRWPRDFKQSLESSGGPESMNSIIAKLATERLPLHNSDDESIRVLEAAPRQEFALLAESIYPFTNLSLEEISEGVSSWPYQQKYEALKQAAKVPGLLRKAKYKLDIITDQVVLAQIVQAAGLQAVQVQNLTPRYGYEVPQAVENAGLDDLYDECFDDSLKLYSLLQASAKPELAPYATLLGHKIRWQLAANAQQLLEVFEDYSKDENYQRVTKALEERVSEIHPLLWDIISRDEGQRGPTVSKNGKSRVKPSRQRSGRRPHS